MTILPKNPRARLSLASALVLGVGAVALAQPAARPSAGGASTTSAPSRAADANGARFEPFKASDPALNALSCEITVLTPEGFTKAKAYPVLLALPPGTGDRAFVDVGIKSYWKSLADRGWVVVSPTQPTGHAFADDGHRLLPALLDEIASRVTIEGAKVHLAGVSNGGRGAFRAATLYPDRFASLTVLPGFPPGPEDWTRLGALKGMNVRMFVGEKDDAWKRESATCAKRLGELGVPVSMSEVGMQGHVLQLGSSVLEDVLEELRAPFRGAPDSVPVQQATKEDAPAIEGVLAEFHAAVAAGEESRVVAALAPEATILGVDPAQRWERGAFVRWLIERDAAQTKSKALAVKAWTAAVRKRTVSVAVGGELAWFDETLHHPEWGDLRGSGVAIKLNAGWFIAQYHLALSIPEDAGGRVVRALKEPAAPIKR